MAYIIWKDTFNIGVPEMDDQHDLFVSDINELHSNVLGTGNSEAALAILEKIPRYADMHFRAEEELLQSASCPTLKVQRQHHSNQARESAGRNGAMAMTAIVFQEPSQLNRKNLEPTLDQGRSRGDLQQVMTGTSTRYWN